MAVSHAFTNAVADAAGTLTVWYGATTATVAATDIVRPSDWNSAHVQAMTITGNTVGQSTFSGTNIVIGGGPNVTISGVNATRFDISAGAGGAGDGGVGVSAGANSVSAGTVVFSNSNGISFGLNGSTVTAQHNALTTARASNDAIGLNTAQSNVTWTVNSAGLSLDARGYAGTGTTFNGVSLSGSMTVNSNGVQLSLSAGPYLTSQSNQAVSAANGSYAFQTLSFSNANGVSFGTSAGSAITASYTVPTVTNSSWTVSDNASSATVARLAFTNLNGVTLSLSTGANGSHTIVGSHNALTSQSNQNVTAGNGGFAFQTLSFSNVNGISFGTSAGSAITASHNAITTARASTDGIGLNTAQTNVTWTVNSAGLSLNAAGYAGTGTTFNGANVSGSMTVNSVGVQLSLSAAAGGAGETRLTAYAVSNTTQSSSGTIPLSIMSFAGAGIASVGITNGSVVISVPAGGGAGDGGVFAGVSTGGNTAGSTGTVSTGNFVLVGSNGITLSQSTGAAGSAATITILGPQRTISGLAVQPFGGMAAGIPFAQSSISLGQNSLYIYPFQIEDHLTLDHLKIPVMLTNSSSAAASVQKGYTYRFGLFTRVNATQISQIYSTSYTMAASHSSNASWMMSIITAIGNSTSYNTLTASSAGVNLSASLHGPRELILPLSTLLTPGEYFVGLAASTSSVGAGGAVLNMSNVVVALQTYNRPGLSTNSSNRAFYADYGMGLYSATTGGIPTTINITQINNNGTQPIMFLGTGTV